MQNLRTQLQKNIYEWMRRLSHYHNFYNMTQTYLSYQFTKRNQFQNFTVLLFSKCNLINNGAGYTGYFCILLLPIQHVFVLGRSTWKEECFLVECKVFSACCSVEKVLNCFVYTFYNAISLDFNLTLDTKILRIDILNC